MGPNRLSDPAARPPDIGTQCSDLKLDSDDVPIYDPDPFIRVEKHGIIHIYFLSVRKYRKAAKAG